jgi:hypothetical protein
VVVQGGHHGVLMLRAEVLILLELVLLMAVAILFSLVLVAVPVGDVHRRAVGDRAQHARARGVRDGSAAMGVRSASMLEVVVLAWCPDFHVPSTSPGRTSPAPKDSAWCPCTRRS